MAKVTVEMNAAEYAKCLSDTEVMIPSRLGLTVLSIERHVMESYRKQVARAVAGGAGLGDYVHVEVEIKIVD